MKYFHRALMDELKKWIDRREILAIRGPRQSGKTTLLNMLKEHLINEKKVDARNVIYITFEDRDRLDAFTRDPKQYIKSYIADRGNEKFYFLIDEFHYVEDGGQKLKLLYDIYENLKFIITGSSSLELTGGVAKYLVGRVFLFNLFQFDLGEFLETKEDENIRNVYIENTGLLQKFIERGTDFDIKQDIFGNDFTRYFEEYIRFGGYPEVIKTNSIETKQIILKNIYDTYITKDIIELLRIEDITGFRAIVALLANLIGDLLNYNSLATDSKSYFRQIKHYLSILEETFVIRIIRPYYSNVTTELKKNPKIYFVDTGLRNHIINNFNELNLRQDRGKLVENVILFQFYEKNDSADIKYWRTTGKAEIDFILDNKKAIIPVEVKYSKLKSPEISRGFRNFICHYKPERALVLTKGFWGKIKINGTKIGFMPVWYV